MNKSRFDKLRCLGKELQSAIDAKDAELMARLYDDLSEVYMDVFAAEDYSFECLREYCLATIVCLRFKAYNNMSGSALEEGKKTIEMIDSLISLSNYSTEETGELKEFKKQIERILAPLKPHMNLVVSRLDCRCTLCRIRPANKTGSHMVPNFLSHPTFSWDGKGKRFHEALNHDYLNAPEMNCQFYGREVPELRFAQGEGKTEVSDEELAKNINQLEYDNEFCSSCEDRFGILESAYSQYYNGQQKKISPRVAYLFWLSVLWRMSMGSMSIFMDMRDELSLRKLLDDNILDSAKMIADSSADLGDWQYAVFRAEGLKDGDKGIFGHRKESSPYVVMFNDLVMVFFHGIPEDKDLILGPITVNRNNLNDWHAPEKSVKVDRRFFMDVRDWVVESSYDYEDRVRETVLRAIREEERSRDCVVSNSKKQAAIKAARLEAGPQGRHFRLHKFQRIFIAWCKLQEAEKNGEIYDPLCDEELFLTAENFHKYYEDLAYLSKYSDGENIEKFPFYEDARAYIPDNERWRREEIKSLLDTKYKDAFDDMLKSAKPKDIQRLLTEPSEPYINLNKNIGRNDPCPCGSGKKYKKCCGRV